VRPYLLLFVACALSGTVIPVPEDITLLGAGATITGPVEFVGMCIAAAAGLFCRDAVFFTIGHVAGEGVFSWAVVQRFVGEERIAKGRALVDRHGGRAVLASRFMMGVRATGFLVSGAMGVRPRDFVLWDALGLAITTPLMMLLGYALGDPIFALVTWVLANKWVVLLFAGIAVAGWWIWRSSRPTSAPDP
jgi:membrane-associated protein